MVAKNIFFRFNAWKAQKRKLVVFLVAELKTGVKAIDFGAFYRQPITDYRLSLPDL